MTADLFGILLSQGYEVKKTKHFITLLPSHEEVKWRPFFINSCSVIIYFDLLAFASLHLVLFCLVLKFSFCFSFSVFYLVCLCFIV